MGGDEAAYGVPLEHPPQAGPAVPLRAVEQYPNPCGRWADVGDFRDAWFAVAWLLSAVAIVGLGGHKWATGDYYRPSSGDVNVTVSGADWSSNLRLDGAGECNFFVAGGVKRLAVARCDRSNLYVGGFNYEYENSSSCDALGLGSLGGLHHDPDTFTVSRSAALPQTFTKGLFPPVTEVTVLSSACTVDDNSLSSSGATWVFPLVCVVALAVSLLFVVLSRAHARRFIIVSNVATSVVLGAFALYCGAVGEILGAVLFGLSALINALFLWCAWHRIPFAALCLEMASHVVLNYWGTVVVALAMLGVTVLFIISFIFCLSNEDGDLAVSSAVFWVAVIAFYWGGETMMNIVHVTTSGVASDWFFARGGPGTPPYFQQGGQGSATLASFKRASLWSLGSICFGSLIVALIRTIRLACRMAMERAPLVVRCLVMCILNFIEGLVEYFNDYAYVQVAMFGKSYLSAAKDTWALVRNGTAWDALINDALLDSVFFMSILQVGAITGLAAYLASGAKLLWLIIGLIAGMRLASVVMQQIYSSVLTVFIGFWHLQENGVMWAPTSIGGYMPAAELQGNMEKQYKTPAQPTGYADMDN